MAKKRFKFNYDWNKAEVVFEVDLEKFTPELANETLGFFLWDYDKEEDPVYEVLKKYAAEVLRISNTNQTAAGIVRMWDQEGFAPINGEMGITLVEFEGFEFDGDDLEMEVIDV